MVFLSFCWCLNLQVIPESTNSWHYGYFSPLWGIFSPFSHHHQLFWLTWTDDLWSLLIACKRPFIFFSFRFLLYNLINYLYQHSTSFQFWSFYPSQQLLHFVLNSMIKMAKVFKEPIEWNRTIYASIAKSLLINLTISCCIKS